ncbi:hypothetical protein [uncultured Megasphaera sp.]|uniref:hypothetical protein n=1 Tax=uncultured Megasphaera sp. TaxID=165188 RepID=UPI0025D8E850|nr:hypothetical protein [uncultured Megasphaera sp.]
MRLLTRVRLLTKMRSLIKSTQNVETQAPLRWEQALANDFLKVIRAAYLSPTDVLPIAIMMFFQKYIKVAESLSDRAFFQDLKRFLTEFENLELSNDVREAVDRRLTQIDGEEFSLQLMDIIDKAYCDEKTLHIIANCLNYALLHEEQELWLECFYRVTFIVLNTDACSLNFLVEEIRGAEQQANTYYKYNRNVQRLLAAGLMHISVKNTGKKQYSFTPAAYKVYKYIMNGDSDANGNPADFNNLTD